MLALEDKRRQKPQDTLARRVDYHMPLEHCIDHGCGGDRKLEACHGSGTTCIENQGGKFRLQQPQPPEHQLADPCRMIDKAKLERVEHHTSGGAGERIPAESSAMASRGPCVADAWAGENRSQREPSADPLGHRNDIGLDIEVLVGEEFSGAS